MIWRIIWGIALSALVYFCYYYLIPFIVFGVVLYRGHSTNLWSHVTTKDGKMEVFYIDPEDNEEHIISGEYTLEPFRHMLPEMCVVLLGATKYLKEGKQ